MLESAEIDYANLSGAGWTDSQGAEHFEDFFMLFDAAVSDACFLIHKFINHEQIEPYCKKSF